MRRFHRDYDLLLTPATAVPAFDVGAIPGQVSNLRDSDWAPFSYPFNLTQQPACSIPCGFTEAGLPIGLQIVSDNFREDLVLRAARAFEIAAEVSTLPPGY